MPDTEQNTAVLDRIFAKAQKDHDNVFFIDPRRKRLASLDKATRYGRDAEVLPEWLWVADLRGPEGSQVRVVFWTDDVPAKFLSAIQTALNGWTWTRICREG